MSTFNRFEDIEAWKLAREITRGVYAISSQGNLGRDFGLKDQLRRSAVSVMANIAEGYERGGNREFIQFLTMAKGSIGEVRSHLYVASDQQYLQEAEFAYLCSECSRLSAMIQG